MKKVQTKVREMEFENIRLIAQLDAGEREDPDVDKWIVVEGDTDTVVTLDNDSDE